MPTLLQIAVGVSDDDFKIGGVAFYARPVSIREYAEFQAAQRQGEEPLLAWVAEKMRARVIQSDHAERVTVEWCRDHIPVAHYNTVQYILLNGRAPEEGENTKASPTGPTSSPR